MNLVPDTYRLYEIKTWKESVNHGDGAGWCTTDQKSYFNNYSESGQLYYLHKKSGGKWRPWLNVYRKVNTREVFRAGAYEPLEVVEGVIDFEIAKRGNEHLKRGN